MSAALTAVISRRKNVLVHRTYVTVAFHQVDMMQIVHNVQYLKWFELGRFGILDRFIDVNWAVKNNLAVPVVMNHCEYLSPAVFGDTLAVTTRHTFADRWTGRLSFEHSISNAKTKVELCRGKSDVTIIDFATRRVLKVLPPEAWERYAALRDNP